jgi:hypothetical protein
MAAKKLLNTVSVGLGLIFLSNIVLSFYFLLFTFLYSFFVIQATSSAGVQGYRGTGLQGCRAAGAIFPH